MRQILAFTLMLVASVAASAATSQSTTIATQSCAGLLRLVLPNTSITSAQVVSAGAFTPSTPGIAANAFANLPAFSRVAASPAWVRLYMAPGMAHCTGGEGPDTFDKLSALEQWVEQGKAPNQIIASHNTNGKIDRTRPLCPYPQVARYQGTGSPDEAANFICKSPQPGEK
jgi:hypothetical protein